MGNTLTQAVQAALEPLDVWLSNGTFSSDDGGPGGLVVLVDVQSERGDVLDPERTEIRTPQLEASRLPQLRLQAEEQMTTIKRAPRIEYVPRENGTFVRRTGRSHHDKDIYVSVVGLEPVDNYAVACMILNVILNKRAHIGLIPSSDRDLVSVAS